MKYFFRKSGIWFHIYSNFRFVFFFFYLHSFLSRMHFSLTSLNYLKIEQICLFTFTTITSVPNWLQKFHHTQTWPISWSCRILWLHLCIGKTPTHTHTHTTECPWYDTKQSDGEVSIMLQLWGMRNTPLLPLLPGPLWPRKGITWHGHIYGLNRTKLRTYTKLNCLI